MKPTEKAMKQEVLKRLVELKLMIDSLKPAYGEYDELLQLIITNGPLVHKVKYQGVKWRLLLIDLFEKKNTAWKSVPQRRFDLEIAREREGDDGIFKMRKRK